MVLFISPITNLMTFPLVVRNLHHLLCTFSLPKPELCIFFFLSLLQKQLLIRWCKKNRNGPRRQQPPALSKPGSTLLVTPCPSLSVCWLLSGKLRWLWHLLTEEPWRLESIRVKTCRRCLANGARSHNLLASYSLLQIVFLISSFNLIYGVSSGHKNIYVSM